MRLAFGFAKKVVPETRLAFGFQLAGMATVHPIHFVILNAVKDLLKATLRFAFPTQKILRCQDDKGPGEINCWEHLCGIPLQKSLSTCAERLCFTF